MPKYRDKVTGQVAVFDHEPTEQELTSHFGMAQNTVPTHNDEADKSVAAPGIGGMVGALIGGKTPLGKIGAGVGAAAGTAYGDLYNMFAHGVGDTTPGSEAKRLATVGGLTTAGEAIIPPILRGVGAIKGMLPQGSGLGSATLGGYLFGHPGAGAAVGAGIEMAPKVASAVDWLGTPAGTSAGQAAEQSVIANNGGRNSPRVQALAADIGRNAREEAGGPLAKVPDYLKQENWGNSLRSGASKIKDTASAAYDELAGLFGGGGGASAAIPEVQPPASFRSPKSVGDISERAGVTGQKVSTLPDMSRNPEISWSADVSAAPQRTPQLSQTSPTDPQMPWEEHVSRSNPKRTSPGGQNWSTPAYDPEVATPPGTVMHGQESGPLSGLKSAQPVATPIGVHDEGLQRWIESGGTPESYLRAKGAGAGGPGPNFNQGVGPEGFGPNTVGAAEAPKFLPKTVDEAKGLSLAEQEAWHAYKAANPGVTDGMLNSWYTSHQMGANPNEGMDINAMADKLTELLRRK